MLGIVRLLPYCYLVLSWSADVTIVGADNITDVTTELNKCNQTLECKPGVILPLWQPTTDLTTVDKISRAIVYVAALAYMFLGVSIVADRFMSSIEVITSKEKQVKVKKLDGTHEMINVRIWNETVSNLTLMALGSSAPEILLSIIEVCGNSFTAGELGPGTIVGSAAFNLFVIIGICVYVIPDGEIRRIKHLRVFFITATWSIFAYLWLYIIIAVTSAEEIEVWEGIVTFLFFPGTVITAYIADQKILVYKFLSKRYRRGGKGILVVTEAGDGDQTELASDHLGEPNHNHIGLPLDHIRAEQLDEVKEFEKHRKEFIETLRELRKKNPDMDMQQLEEMAQYESLNKGPKSRAFYRIQATRKLMGGGNVVKKAKIHEKLQEESEQLLEPTDNSEMDDGDDGIIKIFFQPAHYTVLESVGTVYLTVTRKGGDDRLSVYVDYSTQDGTANAGDDYEEATGTLVFHAGETHKQIPIAIIDDDVFEEDEHFYVHLSNLCVQQPAGGPSGPVPAAAGSHTSDGAAFLINSSDAPIAQLATPFLATVMILDDDHCGVFTFDQTETKISESAGQVEVKVIRQSGARGLIKLPFWTSDGSGRSGRAYETTAGELVFQNEQTEGFIYINIFDEEQYEKSDTFYITLGQPSQSKDSRQIEKEASLTEEERRVAEMGAPRLGERIKACVRVHESEEFKTTVDLLMKKANLSAMVGTSSWTEQFKEALTVSAGDDGDETDEFDESKLPGCMDYVMHYLTIFWKLLFALMPPTEYMGGWLCFTASIIMIGVLTAFIGDLASHFGCTVGLKDSVTAISVVALGTSVPDTFASKVAAIQDENADSSIGNVTGSNAVNVFLGIGIAWTIAAIYHAANNRPFKVKAGSLAFSVTVFCILALICILTMMIRRKYAAIRGELGGPRKFKIPTALFFVGLWLTYVTLSSLESYCVIQGF